MTKVRIAIEVELDEFDLPHLDDYLEQSANVFRPDQWGRVWYQVEGKPIASYFLKDYINHAIPDVDSPPQGIRIL